MSGKTLLNSVIPIHDPLECPFREFRDNELYADAWGLSTAAFRELTLKTTIKDSGQRSGASSQSAKLGTSSQSPKIGAVVPGLWLDDQTQPLPRSVRQYLHGWIRAEDLAMDRWGAEVTIYEESDPAKMSVADIQLSHAQVLLRSSFCRTVLSACFILERVELIVEHQWELFSFVIPPEGWRAKYHIYSPGLKAGGGSQHKPVLSKNGCYLVRLFYLGAWRCVWVNDQVPVDTSGAPLLPFSPLVTHPPAKPGSTRAPSAVTAGVIYLWPLLITKALLKLAAPDMNSDEDEDEMEDEPMPEFDFLHAFTGCMNIRYPNTQCSEEMWKRITTEVPIFSWDDEEDASTIKTKSTKKPTAKELAAVVKHQPAMTYAILRDTKEYPPYHLPGITPGHEMSLIITMARDVPLKKPLPEPEVALWKYYRWVDWARAHGLYAAYDCPRDKYLKVNGLLKSSHAPHLLDVQSTESITMGFIEEHKSTQMTEKDDDDNVPKKKKKEATKSQIQQALLNSQQLKAELREWIRYETFFSLMNYIQVVYLPSMFNFTSAGSNPPLRITKSANTKLIDVVAPKYGPIYLQLDGPEINKVRISFTTLHPRVLCNSGSPIDEFIEPGHLVLERFEWFNDTKLPVQKAFLTTTGYDALEVNLEPGRHFFRIWTHYRINWHMMLMSESSLLLSTRDVIQGAAVRECPWSSKFLLNLGTAFSNWIKISRSNSQTMILADREFFRSYLPDLPWDHKVVGYDRHLLHWMFRHALQSLLSKTLGLTEWKAVSHVLRKYFCDPDFGFPEKPLPPRSLREIVNLEVCDCLMPEMEEIQFTDEQVPEVIGYQEVSFIDEPGEYAYEEKSLVAPEVMDKLLQAPEPPVLSQICEMATDELNCAILKEEREKMIKKHEAAIVLQAHWRGAWARKVLGANIVFTSEVTKYVMERAFGSLEALSMLMNEFFLVWPSTKHAYSVSSALSGVYGLQQFVGTTAVTPKCKWIPHFQGVFYCHAPVKVHFDVQSSVSHSIVEIYNNDTGEQLPQVYNSHITFDFVPNCLGYTVLGHGTLAQVSGINYDAPWQLTIMSCLNGAFHICDNELYCKELPLPHSSKLHIDEIFLPNRRNILGGIQISVTQHQAVSFRAAASSSNLEMVATLRSTLPNYLGGGIEELATCTGKGELYWPYIRLEPFSALKKSQVNISARDLIPFPSVRSVIKTPKAQKPVHSKTRSSSKLKLAPMDPRVYTIEVTCPMGWPLTLDQWKRVDEVRNSIETLQIINHLPKKTGSKDKEKVPVSKPGKPGSAKEKVEKATVMPITVQQPLPGDACVELECALAVGGGAIASRNNERDLLFAAARKSWAALEPGRNQKGAQIRKEFRTEFMVVPPSPREPSLVNDYESYAPSGSTAAPFEESLKFEDTEAEATQEPVLQRPTPVSETVMVEMEVETEEEALYLQMPDQLRDKFIPLYFLPFCMKEKNEGESVLLTPDMAEAAKKDKHARIEAAIERMHELQLFNTQHVIGRQKNRCKMLEKLFVDATLQPELVEVMEQKDEAIAQEVNLRNLSATKKKIEAKKK